MNQLKRFFLYEEYGAKYESMLRNMAMLSKVIPNWSTYERGIEALVNSLFQQNGVVEGSRKGLTHEDLLIKVSNGPLPKSLADLSPSAYPTSLQISALISGALQAYAHG